MAEGREEEVTKVLSENNIISELGGKPVEAHLIPSVNCESSHSGMSRLLSEYKIFKLSLYPDSIVAVKTKDMEEV